MPLPTASSSASTPACTPSSPPCHSTFPPPWIPTTAPPTTTSPAPTHPLPCGGLNRLARLRPANGLQSPRRDRQVASQVGQLGGPRRVQPQPFTAHSA